MNDDRIRLEQLEIRNSQNDIIRMDIRFTDDGRKKPLVIICHSFMAFKNWGFFSYLSEQLAQAGFVSIIFNFSHNGVVGDGIRITDFERFTQNTFSLELDDLNSVLAACVENESLRKIGDETKIALLGHSRGGGIAIVHAASDRRIKALATLSAIATFDRWREHQKQAWRKQGWLPLARDSSISPLRLGIGLLHDLETNGDRLNILKAASQITVPWLILHGKEDVTVPSKEAESLAHASASPATELMLLEHVGHLYNAVSLEEDGYRTLNIVLSTTIKFFHRTLKGNL
ncbi:MAG: alpha/beta fold hydrolase [Bacteroidetes bacterium]|nr:MAG: alpha/beta fold hydrolase [Bacteroidota bacterium]